MDFNKYVNSREAEPSEAGSQNADLALKVANEFVNSAWHTGVTEKAQGVGQLFGMKIEQEDAPKEARAGLVNLAHVAGSTTGEIVDFIVASKLIGKGINGAAGKTLMLAESESLFAKSAFGKKAISAATIIKESEYVREMVTAGTTGAVFGGVFKPVKEGESGYQRIGNGITEAATFITLSAVAGKYRTSFSDDFGGRLQLNALSGGAAGAVNANIDAIMHGRVASVENTLMNSAGWAIGNAVAGEALHHVGKNWDTYQKINDSIRHVTPKEHREPPLLNMLSMREIANRGDIKLLNKQLEAYQPKLQEAFPLEGEIESTDTYRDYLTDKDGTWEMEQLLGPTIGGLQYQILDVGAPTLNKAGWLEHIWVKDSERGKGLGIGLFDHVKTQVDKKGGDLTFWEWNNPDKMTSEQMAEDARGGISTQDREAWWGDSGALIAVDSKGRIAPYAQPSMEEGLPAVDYLSLAFIAPESMVGRKIPINDYLKLCHKAHQTFLGEGLEADATVKQYTADALAGGESHYTLISLKDYAANRASQLGRSTWRSDGD